MGRKKKVISWIFLCLSLMVFLSACSKEKKKDESAFHLYYLNVEETRIEMEDYTPKSKTAKELVNEVFALLDVPAKDSEYINLLTKKVSIEEYEINNQVLILNFNSAYKEMSKQREILSRCGIVRTFAQIEGIGFVKFLIDGQELKKSDGTPVGLMNSETFVENSGKEINSYLSSKVILYYSNMEGNQLVRESKDVYYNSNVPLERVVVEQLLNDPGKQGSKKAIPTDTKILGVTVADQVCYINLDTTFSNQMTSVKEDIPIYSIVNSIIDSCHVKKVQIAINGETNLVFRETIDLNQFFVKKSELIQEEKKND